MVAIQDLRAFFIRRTRVVISEYDELVCSLHVLVRPDHHSYRVEWARQTQSNLPQSLMSQIRAIGDISDSWLGLLGLSDITKHEAHGNTVTSVSSYPNQGRPSYDVLMQKLRTLPDAEFLSILFNGRFDLSQIVLWVQGRDEGAARELLNQGQREALQRPLWTRRKVVEVLESYHALAFRAEWALIEPWLVRAQRVFYEQLKVDPVHALNTLHPRLVAKKDAIYAQKSTLYRWDYEQLAQLVVRPSTFIEPHLLIGIHEMQDDVRSQNVLLSVPFAVRVPGTAKSDTVPEDLVRMYKALSDGTRLKLFRSLFQHPHCTQQLAQIHGISEAAVSKHLKLLVESKFVTTERRGNYVFYKQSRGELEMMIVYLSDFLEQ